MFRVWGWWGLGVVVVGDVQGEEVGGICGGVFCSWSWYLGPWSGCGCGDSGHGDGDATGEEPGGWEFHVGLLLRLQYGL